ncbi:unnamed protein product [Rhizophagus irregularis]|nr:unnamed protein product [Rhizophagus irregularis]
MSKENLEKHEEKPITIKIVNGNKKGNEDEKDINITTKLNVKSKLLEIRKKLEENELIDMNYELLFYNDTYISYENEYDHTLESIMKENTVCLKKYPNPTPTYFIKKFNLDHRFIFIDDKDNNKVEIKEASKGILSHVCSKFTLDNETDDQYVEFNSKRSWTKNKNLFLSAETEIINFGSLGFSFSNRQDTNIQTEKRLSYKFTKVPKVTLKFDKLKLTREFNNEVNEITKLNDRCEKLRRIHKIQENLGNFVPTKIILGGMIQYHTEQSSDEYSTQKSQEGTANITSPGADVQGGFINEKSTTQSTGSNMRCSKLIGGEQQDIEKLDKDKWIKSLVNYENWVCIEFRDLISIFRLLDDDKLCKEISIILGKKILYYEVISKNVLLNYGEHYIVNLLDECEEIRKFINNKDAKCNIFATVVDNEEKKNIFFNCQIYRPQDEPQIVIYCFQKKQVLTHKLKIGFMIIGYDLNFNCNNTMRVDVEEFSSKDICHNKLQTGPNKFCIGIPVLRNLMLDDSIVIGHYFLKEGNSTKACVFSYCLNNKKFVELPSDFSFHILISMTDTTDEIPFEKRCICKCKKTCPQCKDKKNKSSDIRCNYFDLNKRI